MRAENRSTLFLIPLQPEITQISAERRELCYCGNGLACSQTRENVIKEGGEGVKPLPLRGS